MRIHEQEIADRRMRSPPGKYTPPAVALRMRQQLDMPASNAELLARDPLANFRQQAPPDVPDQQKPGCADADTATADRDTASHNAKLKGDAAKEGGKEGAKAAKAKRKGDKGETDVMAFEASLIAPDKTGVECQFEEGRAAPYLARLAAQRAAEADAAGTSNDDEHDADADMQLDDGEDDDDSLVLARAGMAEGELDAALRNDDDRADQALEPPEPRRVTRRLSFTAGDGEGGEGGKGGEGAPAPQPQPSAPAFAIFSDSPAPPSQPQPSAPAAPAFAIFSDSPAPAQPAAEAAAPVAPADAAGAPQAAAPTGNRLSARVASASTAAVTQTPFCSGDTSFVDGSLTSLARAVGGASYQRDDSDGDDTPNPLVMSQLAAMAAADREDCTINTALAFAEMSDIFACSPGASAWAAQANLGAQAGLPKAAEPNQEAPRPFFGRVVPRGEPSPSPVVPTSAAASGNGGFAIFRDTPGESAAQPPVTDARASANGVGFGIFRDSPAESAAPPAVTDARATANGSTGGGFGIFRDSPAESAAPPAVTDARATAGGSNGVGFGIFSDSPGENAAPPPVVVADARATANGGGFAIFCDSPGENAAPPPVADVRATAGGGGSKGGGFGIFHDSPAESAGALSGGDLEAMAAADREDRTINTALAAAEMDNIFAFASPGAPAWAPAPSSAVPSVGSAPHVAEPRVADSIRGQAAVPAPAPSAGFAIFRDDGAPPAPTVAPALVAPPAPPVGFGDPGAPPMAPATSFSMGEPFEVFCDDDNERTENERPSARPAPAGFGPSVAQRGASRGSMAPVSFGIDSDDDAPEPAQPGSSFADFVSGVSFPSSQAHALRASASRADGADAAGVTALMGTLTIESRTGAEEDVAIDADDDSENVSPSSGAHERNPARRALSDAQVEAGVLQPREIDQSHAYDHVDDDDADDDDAEEAESEHHHHASRVDRVM